MNNDESDNGSKGMQELSDQETGEITGGLRLLRPIPGRPLPKFPVLMQGEYSDGPVPHFLPR